MSTGCPLPKKLLKPADPSSKIIHPQTPPLESYIPISHLNDFIFCPRSLYYHPLYGQYRESLYHQTAQSQGKYAHRQIDRGEYHTRKSILSGLEVYSQRYQIGGKIDILDTRTDLLIERKRTLKKIYPGYRYQLYGQYYCLQEMGYRVEQLCLHSLTDNRRYPIPLPDQREKEAFETLLQEIQTFSLEAPFKPILSKCQSCIYHTLCDASLVP